MTKRERTIAALQHKETDFIPYDIRFTNPAFKKMVEFYNDECFEDKIGNHFIGAHYPIEEMPVSSMPGHFIDDFGAVWDRGMEDMGVVSDYPIFTPDMSLYQLPEIRETELRKRCEETMADTGGHFRCGFLHPTLFERAWALTGMENLLFYMADAPDFVHELFSAITDMNLKILKIFLEYDFDGMYFGDDWGQQHGLIMGPPYWRKFIKPSMSKMYSLVRDNGCFIIQHSCGDIREILPDVIEIGLDVYQTFQPEIYDIESIKNKYGDRLSFWGGISTQRLLPFESPCVIIDKTVETLKILGRGGGYIAAPTHAIPGDVPAENIDALIGLLQNQSGAI